jgi:hypothetical protein
MRALFSIVLLLPAFCWGHHSRSAFDLDNDIAVEGLVTEVAWTNPHYYLGVTQTTETGTVAWTFEGHSIPGLVRNGWSRTSMRVGERVRVIANPNQTAGTPFGLLDHVTRTDGQTFYSFRRPASEAAVPELPLQPATSMAGTWRLIRSLRANLVGVVAPPQDWPLLPAALDEVEKFDIREDPALRCEPNGLPRMLVTPYSQHWRAEGDGFGVEIEHSTQHRRIYSKSEEMPVYPSPLGISVGEPLADGSYQIVSSNFPPQPWGNARGISSSAQKKVTELYSLVDDGYKLRLEYTIEDPEYLARPISKTEEYQKVHDFEFAAEPACDIQTATRHLKFEE